MGGGWGHVANLEVVRGESDVGIAVQRSVSWLDGPLRITDYKKRKETWKGEYAKL